MIDLTINGRETSVPVGTTILQAAADPKKILVTQIAPAVRLAIAEELGMESGQLSMDKFVAGLKELGFDYVLHTNFTADLAIMEEGHELLRRIQEGGALPMFTSCCPAWVRFAESFYPEQLDHLSSCKSPQQMFGSLVKGYWAEKMGIDPANIYSVSIMPCIAKKYEAQRPEMNDSGFQDVDLVLTTREVGRLFKMNGIHPADMQGAAFDPWMGEYTGAGVLFDATGGVMEATLRTVSEIATGRDLEQLELTEVRGMEGIREAEVDLDGTVVKVAVANGLSNAGQIMEDVQNGTSPYHFVEVMVCPGGCASGSGQPITVSNAIRAEKVEAIYGGDQSMPIRKAHENQEVLSLYLDFLDEPLGHHSRELLHTHYTASNVQT